MLFCYLFVLIARQNAKKKSQEKVEEAPDEEDSDEASSSETEDSEEAETEEAEEETGTLPIICHAKSPPKRLVRVFQIEFELLLYFLCSSYFNSSWKFSKLL